MTSWNLTLAGEPGLWAEPCRSPGSQYSKKRTFADSFSKMELKELKELKNAWGAGACILLILLILLIPFC